MEQFMERYDSKHPEFFPNIHPKALIGEGCILAQDVVMLDSVSIGDGAWVGPNVVIYEGTVIGKNASIEAGVVLGRVPRSGLSSMRKVSQQPPLEIGQGCIIGVHAVLYRGTKLGNDILVGDLASIREQVIVGDNSIIGRLVMIEPNTNIGIHVTIQTGTIIGGDAVIEDNVFIGLKTCTTNDNSMGRGKGEYKGPHIKKGARIGSNATLLPGVVIGEDAIVAAGSIVTRDVAPRAEVRGMRAREVDKDGTRVCAICGRQSLVYREEMHNYKCTGCGHIDFRGYGEE